MGQFLSCLECSLLIKVCEIGIFKGTAKVRSGYGCYVRSNLLKFNQSLYLKTQTKATFAVK